MITAVDARLREEARHFKFIFACPSCAWFEGDNRTCVLGYPNADHLEEGLEGREFVVFCKAFELT